MWEIFFLSGLTFLLVGIIELKRYSNQKYSPIKMSKKPLKIITKNKQNSEEEINQKRIIPLGIGDNLKKEVSLEEYLPEKKNTLQETSTNTKVSPTIEEKRRAWNEHWIVKKVKERFEKKEPTLASLTTQKEEPTSKTENTQNIDKEVFTSLLKERETTAEKTFLSENNNIENLEKENKEENSTNKKDKDTQNKEDEEREFNPFNMFE